MLDDRGTVWRERDESRKLGPLASRRFSVLVFLYRIVYRPVEPRFAGRAAHLGSRSNSVVGRDRAEPPHSTARSARTERSRSARRFARPRPEAAAPCPAGRARSPRGPGRSGPCPRRRSAISWSVPTSPKPSSCRPVTAPRSTRSSRSFTARTTTCASSSRRLRTSRPRYSRTTSTRTMTKKQSVISSVLHRGSTRRWWAKTRYSVKCDAPGKRASTSTRRVRCSHRCSGTPSRRASALAPKRRSAATSRPSRRLRSRWPAGVWVRSKASRCWSSARERWARGWFVRCAMRAQGRSRSRIAHGTTRSSSPAVSVARQCGWPSSLPRSATCTCW